MVLTERDRALLGYLGVARYVTAAQAHRLLAPGRDKAITSRRLARLCEQGPNPGDGAYLARLAYRRSNSLPFPVWMLTPHGRALAGPVAPGPVATAQAGVGIGFVERVLALNEVLLALVLAGRRSEAAPLTALPFRWRVPDDALRFEVHDRVLYGPRPAMLKPGAIVELLPARRRVFLELEVGATSLAPVDPRQGHLKTRLDRYSTFFLGFKGRDMKRTWYSDAFPDGFAPEVCVLARTEARRVRIEAFIREHLGREDPRYGRRALTLPGAIAALTPLVASAGRPGPPPAPRAQPSSAGPPSSPRSATAADPAAPPGPPVRTVAIDDGLARQIRHGLRLFVETYNSIRKQTSAHASVCPMHFKPDPGPVAELNAFNDLVWDAILGMPREPEKGRKP
jgi:hypothetical protein